MASLIISKLNIELVVCGNRNLFRPNSHGTLKLGNVIENSAAIPLLCQRKQNTCFLLVAISNFLVEKEIAPSANECHGVLMSNLEKSRRAFSRGYHRLALYRGAIELGWYDFYARFRGSIIGPFWPPIQMAAFVFMIALLLQRGLGDSVENYVLYMGLGYYAWDFISTCLTEGSAHFTAQGQLIKNLPISISQITVRKISFLMCRAALNAPIPIVLIIFFGGQISFNVLFLVPVVILYVMLAYSCLTIFGIIGAYLRDFTILMQTVTRFAFFCTPIIWQADAGFRKVISSYNPISYYLEILRAPLFGEFASIQAWVITAAISVGGFILAWFMQSAFRNQLVYRL